MRSYYLDVYYDTSEDCIRLSDRKQLKEKALQVLDNPDCKICIAWENNKMLAMYANTRLGKLKCTKIGIGELNNG